MPRRARPPVLGAALLLLAAAPAAAQVIRFPAREDPAAWASLSAGVVQFQDVVDDGTTGSAWDLETTLQYRASLERAHGTATSYGVVATYARPSVRYTGPVADVSLDRVDARATVSSLAAVFRVGGGAGLHQVIEVSAGARRYAGFETRRGERLAPRDGDLDFTGSLGFGVGYTLGQRATVTLVQDAYFTFHQRDESPTTGFYGGIHRGYVTRLGFRYGLGNRSRLR